MKDPADAILTSYYNLLNNAIVVDNEVISVGTKLDKDQTDYVLIYIKDIENMSGGGDTLVQATMGLQIVTMLEVTEGSDSKVNDIMEQVVNNVENPDNFVVDDWIMVGSRPGSMDRNSDLTDTHNIITRELEVINYLQKR